ncbi:MAG: hypothetical protein ACTSUK_03965 [Promethearchaeota archaeon]
MKLKCYFAHPYYTIGTYGEKRIKEELKSRRLEVIDPFEKEQKLLKEFAVEEYYTGPQYYELARKMWTKDMGYVKTCDIVVAWIPDYRALGTAMEIAIAYEAGKFIQIISPLKHPSYAVYADQYFLTIADWVSYREYKWEKFKK